MEELILRYYSKASSFLIIFILILYFIYIFIVKEISIKNDYFFIEKNQHYNQVFDKNLNEQFLDLWFYKLVLKILLLNDVKLHFGKFKIIENSNFIYLIKTITTPSNYYENITIVEGWLKKDLNKILKENFSKYYELEYNEVIADTYFFNKGSSFKKFKNKLDNIYNNLKEKYKINKLSGKFSFNEILIIGSLLEKEGIDYNDKKKIYSVIINRLSKKMRLQIDATVVYAITEGKTELKRDLTYRDLKIEHNYNTYHIFGLPPEPISYVGLKTIELIFENYNTDYLFYFYNTFEDKHIFSKNYKNHLKRLNEYRSKK